MNAPFTRRADNAELRRRFEEASASCQVPFPRNANVQRKIDAQRRFCLRAVWLSMMTVCAAIALSVWSVA